MIELANEQLINIKSLPGIIPPGRNGKRLSYSTLWRWVLQGVKTPTGPVRLEALKCGSAWLTTMSAVERFLSAQTPQFDTSPAPTRTPGQRQRAAERAAKQLESVGI